MKRNTVVFWLVFPYLLYTFVFFLLPLLWAFYLSFMDWNLISIHRTFVGFENFIRAFQSEKIHTVFINTYRYYIALYPMILCLSIFLGYLEYIAPPRIKHYISVIFFTPYLSAGVAMAIVAKNFLSYSSFFNTFLREYFFVNINWFNVETTALIVIVGLIAWKMSGYYALFVLSGLQSIPSDILEAARIEGCSKSRIFFSFLLPMLFPVLSTITILATGLIFGIFSEPYLLTGGGPNLFTQTWQMEIYYQAFGRYSAGYASAIAIICSITTFLSVLLIRKGLMLIGRKYAY